MVQITPAHVRACYEAALQVRGGKISPTLAVKLVENASGMTSGSALDYIYNTQHLIRGESYKRTMNPQATALLLQWIGEDFGIDIARRAAQAVIAHVNYYQKLPRSGPQTAVRQVAEALLRAKGVCEHCFAAAPFNRLTNGEPYLEVHHRIPLAQGGLDTIANAIALCPNCHREAHCGVERGKFTYQNPKG